MTIEQITEDHPELEKEDVLACLQYAKLSLSGHVLKLSLMKFLCDSFLISNTPNKLVKVNLGTISNAALLDIVSANLKVIQNLNLKGGFLIEFDQDSVTFIKRRIRPCTNTKDLYCPLAPLWEYLLSKSP